MKVIICLIALLSISSCSSLDNDDCDMKRSGSMIKIGKSHPIWMQDYRDICR